MKHQCNVRPKLYTPGNLLGKFQKKGVVQTRHLLTLFSHDSQYFISQNSAKHGKLNGNPQRTSASPPTSGGTQPYPSVTHPFRWNRWNGTEWALHDPPPRFDECNEDRGEKVEENFPGKYLRADANREQYDRVLRHSQLRRHDDSACTRRALMTNRIRE